MKKSVNLNSKEWCDIVFNNKNKSYGAYRLRQSSSKRHILAFLATIFFAIIIAALPMIIQSATANKEYLGGIDETYRLINIIEPETPKEDVIDVAVPDPPAIKEETLRTIQFVAPTIGDDIDVPKELETKTMEDVFADNRAVGYINVEEGTDDRSKEILREEKKIVDKIIEAPPVDFAEIMPVFPGGQEEMMRYISKHLKYPMIDQELGNQGRVIVKFIVSKTGAIEKAEVVRGISNTADREAIRVVESMPKWIPGKQNGEPVAVYFNLPILFKLQ